MIGTFDMVKTLHALFEMIPFALSSAYHSTRLEYPQCVLQKRNYFHYNYNVQAIWYGLQCVGYVVCGGGARVSEISRFYSFLVSSSTFLQENKGLIYMYNFW